MSLKRINFKSIGELKEHLRGHQKTFYYSSQTSTVIPYDKLEQLYKEDDFILGDLSNLPSHFELLEDGYLRVSGPLSWKDAREYLKSQKRNIMTSPTEELALVLAGAATSCTGERCFSFGNLRSQIRSITYLDYNGEEKTLEADKSFGTHTKSLVAYQEDYKPYTHFKNAPFPRFEKETDLLIGTEGQLGVITQIEIQTTRDDNVSHLFMLVPKWEDNIEEHLDIIKKIQPFRDCVYLCEFIDSNSFTYLPIEQRPNQEMDAIFFEVIESEFENFYQNFLLKLNNLDEDKVFELSANKFHALRASIPRAVFEKNSHMGVTKMGTDVQVTIDKFADLMKIYQDFAKIGVGYNLFGHFGDAHLHFNFMPKPSQMNQCQKEFETMYLNVKELGGSPFAEHGIGILKQKYIKNFWSKNQVNTFKELKVIHDPYNQFFPQGFMNMDLK